MFSSDVRVDVWRVLALQAAIRTLKLGLVTARGTQVRVQRALILVSLRTLRAHVVAGSRSALQNLDWEGRILETASCQMTF